MFVFPDELRKAYEAVPIPQVFYQFVDGKVVPLLVSDGFCRLVGMGREETMKWLVGGQFERMHPDDAGNVAHVSDEFAHHRGGYDVIFRARHSDGYHYIHAVGEWMTMPDGTELAFLITENYPVLQYMYGGENGVNALDIQTANGFKSIPCPDVKRLYTREAQGSSGISKLSADGKSSEVYDIQGRRISSGATSLEGLPKGVYIVDGRKVIK